MMGIYDTMEFVKPEISTICMGQAASAAAVLLAAGTKGKRFCAAARPGAAAPAVGRGAGPVGRHRDPGARDPAHPRHPRPDPCGQGPARRWRRSPPTTDRDFILTAEDAKDYGLVDEILEDAPGAGARPRGGLTPRVRAPIHRGLRVPEATHPAARSRAARRRSCAARSSSTGAIAWAAIRARGGPQTPARPPCAPAGHQTGEDPGEQGHEHGEGDATRDEGGRSRQRPRHVGGARERAAGGRRARRGPPARRGRPAPLPDPAVRRPPNSLQPRPGVASSVVVADSVDGSRVTRSAAAASARAVIRRGQGCGSPAAASRAASTRPRRTPASPPAARRGGEGEPRPSEPGARAGRGSPPGHHRRVSAGAGAGERGPAVALPHRGRAAVDVSGAGERDLDTLAVQPTSGGGRACEHRIRGALDVGLQPLEQRAPTLDVGGEPSPQVLDGRRRWPQRSCGPRRRAAPRRRGGGGGRSPPPRRPEQPARRRGSAPPRGRPRGGSDGGGSRRGRPAVRT